MSRFRTTHLSEPAYESDHLRMITVKTPNLQGRGNIVVFVPPGVQSDRLPICILLHGVYGSASAWTMKAGVHHTARQMMIEACSVRPMILAMPSDGLWGDGSAYLPHHGYNFERWISEDVVDAVKENIPQATLSRSTCITGLSMGGFGALRIGAKYPEKFQAISGHSSITSLDQMALFVEEPLDGYRQADKTDEGVFLTMEKNKDRLPPIRFDCGKEDLLIEYNRTLHQQMEAAGIAHTYEEFEGSHEWPYWAEHIQETLVFFDRCI